ncbi:helix-turn-helix domain-containing protein [Mariniflexile sp. HMF6888]|uniref:helix-turn-helix domain-containing protein n=1 Tax=Mariniflexile sp. HMF6888 TaxID=3373086 RepID=UPI003794D92D
MNYLNLNIFNIVILVGIIHGFIFSLVIAFNKKLHSKANYFLVLTILALAFSNLQYWVMDTGLINRSVYDRHHLLFIPFEFLILPFFYFFVKSYLDNPVRLNEKILLYSPFILCMLYLGIKDVLQIDIKLAKTINLIIEYASILLSTIIVLLIFKVLNKYEKSHSKPVLSNIKIKTKWLKNLLYLGLVIILIWFVSISFLETTTSRGFYIFYPLWISITLIIYWIGYTAIIQKQIFIDRKEIRAKKENILKVKTNKTTYNKIDTLINDSKLHLNPALSLQTLSQELNLSEGYISQLINKNSNLNFNDYINSLRVNDAKEMLVDNQYDNYTIISIGLEAGFNSKSSFYTAFKKFTGKTPLEYKKDIRNL